MLAFIVCLAFAVVGMVESVSHRSGSSKGEITCIRRKGLYHVSTSDGRHVDIYTDLCDVETAIADLIDHGYTETSDE